MKSNVDNKKHISTKNKISHLPPTFPLIINVPASLYLMSPPPILDVPTSQVPTHMSHRSCPFSPFPAQKITLCFFISCLSLFQSKYKELSLSTTSSKFRKKWNGSLIVKGKVLIKCTRWYKQNYTITVPIICTHKQTCSWLRHWNKESENSQKRQQKDTTGNMCWLYTGTCQSCVHT